MECKIKAMKKGNDSTIQQAISAYMKSYQLTAKMNEAKLKNNWEAIFGKTINKYTTNISLQKQTLTIYISAAPLKTELDYNKLKIINLINEFFKEDVVKDVVVV
jgi:Dna[CI] antecedent, DciA